VPEPMSRINRTKEFQRGQTKVVPRCRRRLPSNRGRVSRSWGRAGRASRTLLHMIAMDKPTKALVVPRPKAPANLGERSGALAQQPPRFDVSGVSLLPGLDAQGERRTAVN